MIKNRVTLNLRITASSTIVAIVVLAMIFVVETSMGWSTKEGQAWKERNNGLNDGQRKKEKERAKYTALNDAFSTRHPVNSAASKRLTVFTGAERGGRPIVEIRAHVMARTGRRSYFATPQHRAGTHVLLSPRLQSGEELCRKTRIAKRRRCGSRRQARAQNVGGRTTRGSNRKSFRDARITKGLLHCQGSYRLDAARDFRVGRLRWIATDVALAQPEATDAPLQKYRTCR